MLPARSIIFALGGIALSTVLFLGFIHPATRHSFCTPSHSLPSSVLTTQRPHDRKLHLLVPINAGAAKGSRQFCQTLLSAIVHGYVPTIINWDVEHEWMQMQRMKVTGAHQFLSNITDKSADNDLVLLVDAFDVWFQVSPKILTERFEELNTPGVVTAAEVNCCCWPYEFESVKSSACRRVPKSTLPKGAYALDEEPRSANSGTVIGSVAAMRPLFRDLFNILQEPERQTQGDQGAFNEFLADGRGQLSLDYRSRLFWSTAYSPPTIVGQFINTPYHMDTVIPHELYPPLLYQTITGEIPALVHFNGPEDKGLMDEWWGKLWWNKLTDEDDRFRDIVYHRVEGAMVNFAGGGSKDWRELCPRETTGF